MSKGKIGTCPELNIKILPPQFIKDQNDTRRTQRIYKYLDELYQSGAELEILAR